MKEKDIEDIKFDLGLCVDVLMSIFFAMFISEVFGKIFFWFSLVTEIILLIRKKLNNLGVMLSE